MSAVVTLIDVVSVLTVPGATGKLAVADPEVTIDLTDDIVVGPAAEVCAGTVDVAHVRIMEDVGKVTTGAAAEAARAATILLGNMAGARICRSYTGRTIAG